MDTTSIIDALQSLMFEDELNNGPTSPFFEASVSTFEEAGVLTNDAGLVIRTKDNREFQLTLIRSR